MGTTSVTRKGQVTIPADVRRALSIKERDKVLITLAGKVAVIQKVPALLDLEGSVHVPKRLRGAPWKEIEKKAREARARRAK